MTDFMELLYHYARTNRFPGCLPPCAYKEVTQIEERTLSALREGLSAPHAAALERYQDASEERRTLELEAMFLAAFSMARELCRA